MSGTFRAAWLARLALLALPACRERVEIHEARAPDEVWVRGVEADDVVVAWSEVPGASGYVLETTIEAPPPTVTRTHVEGTEASVYTVPNGESASFTVRAVVGGRESEPTAAVRIVAFSVAELAETADQVVSGTAGMELGTVFAAGDFNRDGIADLVAGAPAHASDRGVFFLYFGTAEGLSSEASFQSIGDGAGYRHASALAAGDVDGDGYDDLLVGTPFTSGAGFVELFLGSPSNFDFGGGVAGTGAQRLGAGVAVLEDLDGDGDRELAIAGAGDPAVVRVLDGGDLPILAGTPRAEFTVAGGFPDPPTLAAMPDFDGDARPELFVGNPGLDVGSPPNEAGEGILYALPPGGPQAELWSIAGPDLDGRFGSAALSFDVTGDDAPDLLVGAPEATDGRLAEGRLLLFEIDDGALEEDPSSALQGGAAGAGLGSSLCAGGDLYRDGRLGAFVGMPGFDGGRGRVAFVRRNSGAVSSDLERAWTAEGPQIGDTGFGGALACGDFDGNGLVDLVVGAPHDDVGGAQAGAFHVFLTRHPHGPLARAGAPRHVAAGERFAPDGATLLDPLLRRRWTCRWDFGDGTIETIDPCTPENVGDVVHAYADTGIHRIVLRVTRVEDGRTGEGMTTAFVE